jgi:hypothetical protein
LAKLSRQQIVPLGFSGEGEWHNLLPAEFCQNRAVTANAPETRQSKSTVLNDELMKMPHHLA